MRRLLMPMLAQTILAWSCSASQAHELIPIATFGTPASPRTEGHNGPAKHVAWAGDSIFVSAQSHIVSCQDIKTKQLRWSTMFNKNIDLIAVNEKLDRVFVLDDDHDIHVHRLSDGKQLDFSKTIRQTLQSLEERFSPIQIGVTNGNPQLFISTFAYTYGKNGLLLDATNFVVTGTFQCAGYIRQIHATADGCYITTLSDSNNIRIWDNKHGKEIFNRGWNEDMAFIQASERESPIDAPFMSNAAFDGVRTLVYTVDNSWRIGKVHVYDTEANKEVAMFTSRHGHVVMAVDFAHGRIALTGTERSLTLTDLAGNVVAERENAAWQRNFAVAFSPDGQHLAIGSQDNTVRIFAIQ